MLFDGPSDAPLTVLLAHGAGAPSTHPFMAGLATGLGARGWRVARLDFPYMQRRAQTGRKSPPDRLPRLQDAFRAAASTIEGPLVVGGKSMGGRVASTLADELDARGLLVFGYPFHAPGRLDRMRTEHLVELRTPALILQGERDPFGRPQELDGVTLSEAIHIEWVPDGDHSLRPRKRSGHTEEGNLALALDRAHAFLSRIAGA